MVVVACLLGVVVRIVVCVLGEVEGDGGVGGDGE